MDPRRGRVEPDELARRVMIGDPWTWANGGQAETGPCRMVGNPRQYITPGYTFCLPRDQLGMGAPAGQEHEQDQEDDATQLLCVLRDEMRSGQWLVEIFMPGPTSHRPTILLRVDKVYGTLQGTTR